MIRPMRHGSRPRLMALQHILSLNRRESLPTPSAGDRITSSIRVALGGTQEPIRDAPPSSSTVAAKRWFAQAGNYAHGSGVLHHCAPAREPNAFRPEPIG